MRMPLRKFDVVALANLASAIDHLVCSLGKVHRTLPPRQFASPRFANQATISAGGPVRRRAYAGRTHLTCSEVTGIVPGFRQASPQPTLLSEFSALGGTPRG